MQIKNLGDKSVKLAPNTVLMTLSQGRLHEATTRAAGDVIFELKPKSMVLLKTSGSSTTAMPLSQVIVEHKINTVYQYNGFTAGVPPASLTAKKLVVLSSSPDSGISELVKAVAASSKVQWLWVVEVKGTKVMPCAASLCVKKQIVRKAAAIEAV